jgi:hypothetical protein
MDSKLETLIPLNFSDNLEEIEKESNDVKKGFETFRKHVQHLKINIVSRNGIKKKMKNETLYKSIRGLLNEG